jgi:hypothetical protein
MAFNQLGTMNFADLARYIWRSAQDFGLFQTYVENLVKELAAGERSAGVIYGGVVTPTAGLGLSVSKGLALMSTGQLVTWDDQAIALGAADGANPRIDRIELGYTLVDGAAVTNIDNVVKTLERRHTGTAAVLAGVAAGAPVAPAKTAGKLSLGTVKLATGQLAINATDINQADQVRDYARRANHREVSVAIPNNQVAFGDLQNLALDSGIAKTFRLVGHLFRRDNAEERSAFIEFRCRYKSVAAGWQMSVVSDGDDMGADFQITTAGVIQVLTDNMAGGAYASSLTVRIEPISQ